MGEERALILTPAGRDAAVTRDLLRDQQIEAVVCPDLDALVDQLELGAGVALVTEEVLAAGETSALLTWIAGQPRWSDFPFIVLSNGGRGRRSPRASAVLEALGNIVLLDRPLHAEALIRATRSAQKARRRQYEVREFADTLHRTVDVRTRELAEARDSLEIALDAAELGSWELDLATGGSRRTLRHDEIFGYARLQPHWGREIFLSHVVEGDYARVEGEFDQAVAKGWLESECRISGADGNVRWISAKARVQYAEDGAPLRMTGVVADITDRKEAESQLAQAQKMDTIGQLTGGVAHDFNNLLTPIVGSLDLLRRRLPDDERSLRLVDAAQQAAERAATLTQRLLAFARRQALQPQAVDTGALINGLVDLMSRSLGPRVELVVEVASDLCAARVDPNQLELALLNLAVNARDAMPTGGRLTLAAVEEEMLAENTLDVRPGRYLKISTADTGVGMDAATLQRAIDPFFSTKGVGKGTGLGLSMAHGLAAQSGGALCIRSKPGQGTTVDLWFPTSIEAAVARGERGSSDAPARGTATVLLVDDEDLVRSVTADLLGDLGYTVLQASSGARALSMLGEGLDIDLIISDYLMPGMSGGALIAELREAGYRTPVLLITGYANAAGDVPPDVPRLAKPFRQVDIASRLHELLARSRSGKRAPMLRIVREPPASSRKPDGG